MQLAALLAAAFSAIIGPLLVAAYLRGTHMPKRTAFSISTCIAFSVCMFVVQWFHLQHFISGPDPLAALPYRACVFLAPALFFYFGRAVVLPDEPASPLLILHLVPFALSWLLPLHVALPLLLMIGAGYALWLGRLVVTIRRTYRQHRFELLFSAVLVLCAALVLLTGSLAQVSSANFYQAYSLSIGLAYACVTFALVAIPDFLNDLFEITKARYAVSTLTGVDTEDALKQLDALMLERALYKDEALNLSSLAEELGLSSHQTSELINQHRHCSFSQFLRSHRVAESQRLLIAHPEQSVLSIGLEVGFRSQSTFYAAFKEACGRTPGDFRREHA